jgi:hypothetical protein
MATEQFANSAQTTLSAAITSTTATSISVANGGTPFSSSAQFRILIDSELMLVTAGAGTNTWTVTRGIEGTAAATHSNGATVTEVLTAGGLVNLLPSGSAQVYAAAPGGRLTLTSGTPVTTSDVTAAQTLYYTPYIHDQIALYTGSWAGVTFSEKSLKLTDSSQTGRTTNASATLDQLTDTSQLVRGMQISGTNIPAGTTISSINSASSVTMSQNATGSGTGIAITFKLPPSKNYDVFGISSGGALKLQLGNSWTNDTTRADALGTQNGVQVNNAAINSGDSNSIPAKQGLYLGTIRTTAAAGQTEDSFGGSSQSGGHRYVWNLYNRVPRPLGVIDTTNSWNYTTATWRASNGQSANKVEYVCGLNLDRVRALAHGRFANSTATVVGSSGIGIDSTSVNSAQVMGGSVGVASGTAQVLAEYLGYPGVGYHALQWLEISQAAGTMFWYGNEGFSYIQAGLTAEVLG